MGREGNSQWSGSNTIVIFLGFIVKVGRNIHISQAALVGLCSIYDTDDPDEFSFDIPQSEALFHDKLPAWRWYSNVDRNWFDAGECCPRDFDVYSGGIV
jgi:hypothetical protein